MRRTLSLLLLIATLALTSASLADTIWDLMRNAPIATPEMSRTLHQNVLDEIVYVEFDPANGFPQCQCVTACPGDTIIVVVGPGILPDQYPTGTLEAGCVSDEDGRIPIPFQCDDICPPVYPLPMNLPGTTTPVYFDPVTGTYYAALWVTECGCFCICLDAILDVELISFTATPRDAEIQLNWLTASESDGSSFEVMRDGHLVNRMNAQGAAEGANYSWTDNQVVNGTEYSYNLVAIDASGVRQDLGTLSATPNFGSATVSEFALYQNFPNPFNPETSIAFDVAKSGFVQLSIYNIMGQKVATPISREMETGRYIVSFSGASLPSGLYLYRLEASGFSDERKMILIK